jgi:hypothetical protein
LTEVVDLLIMKFFAGLTVFAALVVASPLYDTNDAVPLEKRQTVKVGLKGLDVNLASGTGVPWYPLATSGYRFAVHENTWGNCRS